MVLPFFCRRFQMPCQWLHLSLAIMAIKGLFFLGDALTQEVLHAKLFDCAIWHRLTYVEGIGLRRNESWEIIAWRRQCRRGPLYHLRFGCWRWRRPWPLLGDGLHRRLLPLHRRPLHGRRWLQQNLTLECLIGGTEDLGPVPGLGFPGLQRNVAWCPLLMRLGGQVLLDAVPLAGLATKLAFILAFRNCDPLVLEPPAVYL
mmetsp:Transcript_2573/g.6482  ORF Transcript_2573/g.6482 Transcript_2573/m.6482 type:complete len:201 (-) Transcript_2573:2536-3138(-)